MMTITCIKISSNHGLKTADHSQPNTEAVVVIHVGEGLFKAILANRHDDAARLIYSDWLEDNGFEARARFIRTMIEYHNLPTWDADRYVLHPQWSLPVDDLAVRQEFLGDVLVPVKRLGFQRGLPDWLDYKHLNGNWRKEYEEDLEWYPGTGVELQIVPSQKAHCFTELPSELTGLTVHCQGQRVKLQFAKESNNLNIIRIVGSSGPRMRMDPTNYFNFRNTDATVGSISSKGGLKKLRSLELNSFRLPITQLNKFLANLPESCRTLSLIGSIRGADFDQLQVPAFVETLDVGHNGLVGVHVMSWLDRQELPRLKALRIGYNPMGANTLRQIICHPQLHNLVSLELNDIHPHDKSIVVQSLEESHLPDLRALEIAYNQLSTQVLLEIFGSGNFALLEHLNLDGNQLTDDFFTDLPHTALPSVRSLSIQASEVTLSVLSTIQQRQLFPRLQVLCLGKQKFFKKDVEIVKIFTSKLKLLHFQVPD
ncbi:MAG: TIGR02996 domain-containing protein [Zavarzinella sp.]